MLLLSLLIGIVAGSRSMLAPAAIAWAAASGRLPLAGGPLAFLGYRWAPWIFTLLAIGELVADKLPTTPSRRSLPGFVGRIVSGALCGAALGSPAGHIALGAGVGIVGAVIGTLCCSTLRTRAAGAYGRDLPAALMEDALAILAAALIVVAL